MKRLEGRHGDLEKRSTPVTVTPSGRNVDQQFAGVVGVARAYADQQDSTIEWTGEEL